METREAVAAFAALSHETRLDLIRLLLARAASGLSASDLAAQVRLPASTTSFNLGALELVKQATG
jgi:DNA-binding transcriptional ArsR family regulator